MDALKEKYQRLLEEGIFSDVTFVVVGLDDQEERIKGHKGILSVSSPVFHSLFLESGDEIRIMDINPTTFKALLKCIYISEEPELNKGNWAALLYAADKYEITDLKEECIEFVKKNYMSYDAIGFFIQATKNRIDNLVQDIIKEKMIFNSEHSLTSDSFLEIESNEVVKEVLSFDIYCKEIIIFRSALKWALSKIKNKEDQNGATIRKILGPALHAIRFPRINPNEFINEVIPKGILNDDEILSILKKEDSCPFTCEPRGQLSYYRFDDIVRGSITTKFHSIKFKVDKQVEIDGIELYRPCKEGSVIKGSVFIKDEQNAVLKKKSFEISYINGLETEDVYFDNLICIDPNKWYTACVEFESTPVHTWMGINGHSEIKFEGVKFTFENDSLSEETNVFQGQIAYIHFNEINQK